MLWVLAAIALDALTKVLAVSRVLAPAATIRLIRDTSILMPAHKPGNRSIRATTRLNQAPTVG
jgi:hypothetical protein